MNTFGSWLWRVLAISAACAVSLVASDGDIFWFFVAAWSIIIPYAIAFWLAFRACKENES